MIELMNSNDILEASNLMSETYNYDNYQYERNEAYWIQGLIDVVTQQSKGNKNFLAVKSVNSKGRITAFMLCNTFNEGYTGSVVFDIKDMIVDYNLGKLRNAKDTKALVSYLVEYCKSNGVYHWRADTIHKSEESYKYIQFLDKHFEGETSYTFRGEIK